MTSLDKKIIAVIPAYNECATVGDIVTRTRQYVDQVIVVDDASIDGSADAAEAAGAYVIRYDKNRGYNTVLNEGFGHAKNFGADIIITIDADGEHRPEDIPRFLTPLLEDRAQLTIGARSAFPQIAEYIYSFYSRVRFGVIDPLCGFKAYSRPVIDQFKRFDTMRVSGTEIAFLAIERGFIAENVPIPFLVRKNDDTSRFYARRFYANLKILRAMFSIMAATTSLWPRKK